MTPSSPRSCRAPSDTGWETAANDPAVPAVRLRTASPPAGCCFLVWVHDRNAEERAPRWRTVVWAGVACADRHCPRLRLSRLRSSPGWVSSAAFHRPRVERRRRAPLSASSSVVLLARSAFLSSPARGGLGRLGGDVGHGGRRRHHRGLRARPATPQPPRRGGLSSVADITHTLRGRGLVRRAGSVAGCLRRRRADRRSGGRWCDGQPFLLHGHVRHHRGQRRRPCPGLGGGACAACPVVHRLRRDLADQARCRRLGLPIGAYNKRRLVPAIRAAGDDAWTKLRTTVRLEVAGLRAGHRRDRRAGEPGPARDAAGLGRNSSHVRRPIGDAYQVDITVDPESRRPQRDAHLPVLRRRSSGRGARKSPSDCRCRRSDIGPIEREPTPPVPGTGPCRGAKFPSQVGGS